MYAWIRQQRLHVLCRYVYTSIRFIIIIIIVGFSFVASYFLYLRDVVENVTVSVVGKGMMMPLVIPHRGNGTWACTDTYNMIHTRTGVEHAGRFRLYRPDECYLQHSTGRSGCRCACPSRSSFHTYRRVRAKSHPGQALRKEVTHFAIAGKRSHHDAV